MNDFQTSIQDRLSHAFNRIAETGARRLIVQDCGIGISYAAQRFVKAQPNNRLYHPISYAHGANDQLKRLIDRIDSMSKAGQSQSRQSHLEFETGGAPCDRTDIIIIDNVDFIGGSDILTKFVVSLNDLVRTGPSVGIAFLAQAPYMCGKIQTKRGAPRPSDRLSERSQNILGTVVRMRAADLVPSDIEGMVRLFGGDAGTADYLVECVTAGLVPSFNRVKRATALMLKRPNLRDAEPGIFRAYLEGDQPLPPLQ